MAEQTMEPGKSAGAEGESPRVPTPAVRPALTSSIKRARHAPGFAIALYCLLALSAAVALLGRSSSFLPDMAKLAAPIAFAAFFVLFALYRLALVRARRYSPAKAFIQIGIGALFLLMLAPGVMGLRSSRTELESVSRLLHHADPSVRALACDAFGQLTASEADKALPSLRALLDDPHPGVRERAQRTLEKFGGQMETHAQPPSNFPESTP